METGRNRPVSRNQYTFDLQKRRFKLNQETQHTWKWAQKNTRATAGIFITH